MSTESYHKSLSSVKPILVISNAARPGCLQIAHNRFTGRTYLITSPVKLLPAPIAATPVAATRRTDPAKLDHTTVAGRQQAALLIETGAPTLRDAFQIRFQQFLANRQPTIYLGAGQSTQQGVRA